MGANGRLILGTTVSDEDAVRSDTANSQNLDTSTSVDVQNTASLDVIIKPDGGMVNPRASVSGDDDILLLPVTMDITISRDASLPLDTRLASNHWTADDIGGQFDPQFSMVSNLRNRDAYLTIVDMLGHGQPGVHHLLKEGGNGFITLENGNRILIL